MEPGLSLNILAGVGFCINPFVPTLPLLLIGQIVDRVDTTLLFDPETIVDKIVSTANSSSFFHVGGVLLMLFASVAWTSRERKRRGRREKKGRKETKTHLYLPTII